MSPDIFIEDFEITESTEEIHAILGRSLIIATRFDNLCGTAAKHIRMKESLAIVLDNEKFDEFIDKLFSKFTNLNNNINSLPVEQEFKGILHKARIARNEIAHELTIGMIGCLDLKIDTSNLKHHLSNLIKTISEGDYLISTFLSILNQDPLPNISSSHYKNKTVNWVNGV